MGAERAEALGADELRMLIRDELAQARRETVEELAPAARVTAVLYVTSLLSYLAVVFLTLMTVYILGELIEPWIGAAIVGGTLLAVSTLVVVRVRAAARRAFALIEGRPLET